MQQGDCNAPATFMRLMYDICGNIIGKYVHVYLDDVIIFSDTHEDHLRHVREVCMRLRQAGLWASRKKSAFFAKELMVLGHRITNEGLSSDPSKVSAIS